MSCGRGLLIHGTKWMENYFCSCFYSCQVCVLLAASVASAQTVRGNTISNSRGSDASPAADATLAANPSPASSAAPATSAGTAAAAPAAAAPAPASTAGAAGGRAAAAPGGGLGPAFFGPGLNNPIALPPNQFLVSRAQQVAAANPNVRVVSISAKFVIINSDTCLSE